jgi:hypothetical protein
MIDGAVSECCGVHWLQPVSRFVSVRVEVCEVLGLPVRFWGGSTGGLILGGLEGVHLVAGRGSWSEVLERWVALLGVEQAVVWSVEGALRTLRPVNNVALLVCCVGCDLFDL